MGDKTTKAVFHGRLTGVGVIGEIPQGESSDKQDEQEQALGMLAFNSQGEETGQEGSREQAAREVSEVQLFYNYKKHRHRLHFKSNSLHYAT